MGRGDLVEEHLAGRVYYGLVTACGSKTVTIKFQFGFEPNEGGCDGRGHVMRFKSGERDLRPVADSAVRERLRRILGN